MKKYIFLFLLVISVIAGLASQLYKDHSRAVSDVENYTKNMNQSKTEMIALYAKRVQYLLDWEAAVKKSNPSTPLPQSLKINEAIRSFKDLKLDTPENVNRYDFVQTLVSQTLNEYIQNEISKKVRPAGLEKIEEALNFKRHDYHVAAFEVERLRSHYLLGGPKPLIFFAERYLKDHNLFH